MSLSQTTERIVEIVEPAARSLPDNFSTWDLYGTSVQAKWVDMADIPPMWQESMSYLHGIERAQFSAAITAANCLGFINVGLIRRVSATELVKAQYVGENRAAILKSLGHYIDREISLDELPKPERINGSNFSS
jgi:hypothetical protein